MAYSPGLTLAGIAAGAVEIHPEPDHAMSDGAQSLNFEQFNEMMPKVQCDAEAVDRALTWPQPAQAAKPEAAAVWNEAFFARVGG